MYPLEPAVLRGISFIAMLILMLGIEFLTPFRVSVESKLRRWVKNLSLAAGNTFVLSISVSVYLLWLIHHAESNRTGLLSYFGITGIWNILAAFIIFDFMTYIWHVLNHIVPFLWRFHKVHHTDLDIDVSTASRFHIGELLLSAVFKAALIYCIGPSPLAFVIYESGIVTAAQFHHSNIGFNTTVEKWICYLIVVPSMHRIHHSIVVNETNSNYSVVFSVWDRIARTFRYDVVQEEITIGLPQYQQISKVTIPKLLTMPLRK